MISKSEILNRAMKMGEAYAASASNTFPGDAVVDAYEKIVALAQKEGILSN